MDIESQEDFIKLTNLSKMNKIDHFQWMKIFITLDRLAAKFNISYQISLTDIKVYLESINLVLYIHLKEIQEASTLENCHEWVMKYIKDVEKNLDKEEILTSSYYQFSVNDTHNDKMLEFFDLVSWDLIKHSFPIPKDNVPH